jgi:acid stress-induced BolA-like protein IbaG/YrbA
MVYGLLADEFQQGLHALSIVARTPAEAAAAAAAKALVPDPDGDA